MPIWWKECPPQQHLALLLPRCPLPQDCWVSKGGAYTGEVSAEMLHDMGIPWVILGHSGGWHTWCPTARRQRAQLGGCAGAWGARRGARVRGAPAPRRASARPRRGMPLSAPVFSLVFHARRAAQPVPGG